MGYGTIRGTRRYCQRYTKYLGYIKQRGPVAQLGER